MFADGYTKFSAIRRYLRDFILIGAGFYSWSLWYLLSTIYTVGFILVLMRTKLRFNSLVVVSIVAFLLSYGIGALVEFEGELPNVLFVAKEIIGRTIIHGGIFKGFYYIPLGMLLTKIKIPDYLNRMVAIVGFICLLFVHGLFWETFFVAVVSIAVFGEIRRIPVKNCGVYIILRKMSTVINFGIL